MPTVGDTLEQWQAVAAIAALTVLLGWESIRPFFAYAQDRKARGVHVIRNLVLGGINALAVAALFAGSWVVAAEWAAANNFGLMNRIAGGADFALVHAVGAILLLDAWMYLWHRMNHRIPFLWRFHRVHHADRTMDVSTASRFHLGEIVFSSILRVPIIVMLGVYAWELLLYELMMFSVVQFHHANIAIPARLDRFLRWFIVTPFMHKVHHSRIRDETDSNYSSLLSVWDRIARTYRRRDDPHEIEFGLDEFADEKETFVGLMGRPVRKPRQRSLTK